MHIGLLGTVEARRGADPLPLPGLRLRGLLARLALDADRPVSTTQLVDGLWGEAAPDGAGNALQALVSRLRRAVGAALVSTEGGGYRLRVAPDAVDAARFDLLVGRADAVDPADPATARDLLGQALGLWRGPALADLGDLPFAAAAATRLGERRARAVEGRARLGLHLGDPEPELEALTEQLDALPLREQTAVLLARCLHAANRQADALAVLDRTTARLADELGVDPGPELAAARLAVLRAAPSTVPSTVPTSAPISTPISAPTGAPTTPPADRVAAPPRTDRSDEAVVTGTPAAALSSFVGRAGDLGRITDLLTGTRLVTLIGPGGAGKTRLARETLAALDGPAAPGGRCRAAVAELAALTSADQLPVTLLSAAGTATLVRVQEDGQDTMARLLGALADQDVVLVLDNCEHLVDAVARITETLLAACPQLRVLATSREPLGVPGEVLHPVDALAPADAERLFVERGAAVRPGFVLSQDVAPAVAEICRRLDGQPLPIELAAARLRTLSPAEIATRLDDRFRLLTSGARTALPRHQTLRAVVDWSWDLLAEPERAVARRLAVFAGGATAAGAEAVCGGPAGPAARDVFDLLASLVDKSMVVAVQPAPGEPTRYRMLETIREYAGERLDEAGERPAAEAAHARLALDLVEAAEPHLRRAEQLDWLARLAAEGDEIDIALRRAVDREDAAVAHRLLAAVAWSWFIRGLVDEARRWVDEVDRLDGPAPAAARAATKVYSVMNRLGHEDVAGAELLLDEAVRLAEQVEPPRHPVVELLAPIRALFVTGDLGPTEELAEHAADPWVRAAALAALSMWAANEGRIDDQRRLARAAHERMVPIGDRFGLGMLVFSLGELEDVAGHHEAAARAYDEAIALATELHNDDDLPQFLAARAMLEARHGDLDAARAGLDRAEELVEGRELQVALLAGHRAQLARLTGDLDAARAALEVAAAGMRHVGVAVAQRSASFAAARAQIELAAGDLDAARLALVDAVRWAVEGKDGPVTAMVAEVAARLVMAEGDAGLAGALLGVAAQQRGALDRGNHEVLALDAAIRAELGPAAAERDFRRGRNLPRAAGVELLEKSVAVQEPRIAD